MLRQIDAIYFVFAIGFFLPYLALKSAYGKNKAARPTPSKQRLRLSTLFTLTLFGLFAIWIGSRYHFAIFPRWNPSALEIALGLAMVPLWLGIRAALLPWLRTEGDQTVRLLPEAWNELPMWGLISLCAGVFEEIIYRCVLYIFLAYYTGSPILGGLISALSFGVVHIRQGWRAATFIFALAVIFQAYVAHYQNLYMVMIVHVAYDFIVGILYLRERLSASGDELVDDVPENVS